MSADPEQNLVPRPPVVVVMGHVDHGKTTLLDYIRKSNVAGKEAGGITQSVGAYEIVHQVKDAQHPTSNISRKITFIDTPGHEAFTKMRSRGAKIADLAILIVAAEEGLKPQTKESIKILKDTKTPFVVAINKIDKPEANIDKVKNELTSEGVLLEGYGGHVSFEPISAKTGQNVDALLDLILLAADYESLTCESAVPASGFILEAKMDPRRGLEATVIIKNGILKQGDEIITKTAKGKVKILENFLGEKAKELSPSSPALIIGFETFPQVGEEFKVGKNVSLGAPAPTQISKSITQAEAQDESAIKFIIKASDSGSLEALSAIVKSLPCEKPVLILDESVGDIGDNDIKNAAASKAVIIGFKNKVSKNTKNLADIQKVRILTNDIVYHLVKDIEIILAKPEALAVTGRLEVLAIFNQTKLQKQLVGGKVLDGVIKNRANIEIHRKNPDPPAGLPAKASTEAGALAKEGNNEPRLIGHGKIINLQSGKLDATQIEAGKECGLLVSSSIAIQKGDLIVIK